MAIVAVTPGRGPVRLLDFALRVGPHGERTAPFDGLRWRACASIARPRLRRAVTRLPALLETPTRWSTGAAHITADVVRLRARLARRNGACCW